MKRWHVEISRSIYYSLDIEADNRLEAERKARELEYISANETGARGAVRISDIRRNRDET